MKQIVQIPQYYRWYIQFRVQLVLFRVWTLKPYYYVLLRHALELYRQSKWYEDLRHAFGREYAERDFSEGIARKAFLDDAKREPWSLRWKMLIDATLCRPQRSYLEESVVRHTSINCR